MATAEQTVGAVLDATNKRYVVETGKTENGWFTRYSDGWIEQGGTTQAGTYDEPIPLVFPIEFANAEYSIKASVVVPEKTWTFCGAYFSNKTTTSANPMTNYNGSYMFSYPIDWEAKGFAA